MELTWLDWVLLSVILISSLISLTRGFIKESLSLLIWVLAIVFALVFHQLVGVYLEPHIPSPSLRKAAAVLLLFITTLLTGSLLLFIIGRLVAVTGLSGLDRLLGMVFGALRGVLIVVLLLMLAQAILPVNQELWWKQSQLIPHFVQLEAWVITITDELRQLIQPLFSQLLEQSASEIIQSK
jgi:membrane protein required for colicin V production